jgi:hypothetical protein
MRKIFLLAILFLFASCERGTEECSEPAHLEIGYAYYSQEESEIANETENRDIPEIPAQEPPPKTFAAIPFVYEIFINGEISSLRGFTVNGREYFRPHDIAIALEGTRAQFGLRDGLWGGFPETRNIFHVILHTSPVMPNISVLSPISTEAAVAVPSHLTVNLSIVADGRAEVLEAFKIDGYYFIAPSDWGGFIGFTVEHSPCGAIFICTNEQPLSPHGLRVAEEFLRARPSLFRPSRRAWDEEEFHAIGMQSQPRYFYFRDDWGLYLFPVSYHLHDFNNDGIPEILINYDNAMGAMTRSYFIYAYVGGRFENIGEIPMWGKLYRDSAGRIFSFEGSHYDGFQSVRTLTYENGVFGWEYFIEPFWIWRDDFMDWCDEEWAEWSGLWGDWDVLIPIMPGDTERLTAERRLQNAQTAALHEAVSQYHGLCYCGEMYRHELRFPTPPINIREQWEVDDDFLSQFENVHKVTYLQRETDWSATLIIWADEPIRDFSFVSLDNHADYYPVRQVLFTVENLPPTDAVVLTLAFVHYFHPHGGIAFTNADGTRHTMFFVESMEGGCVPTFHSGFTDILRED